MSVNVETALFEILKAVQESIAGLDHRMAGLERGQAELKEMARKQRRDLAGLLVMMKSVSGDFDERVSDLERRMTAVESRP